MAGIEPNVAALAWFALFVSVASLSFFLVAGAFPLSSRTDIAQSRLAVALATGNAVLMTLMVVAALAYGITYLRWTSVVIVAGFAILFTPGLLEVWPARWRDGPAGLAILFAILAATVALAQSIGGLVKL